MTAYDGRADSAPAVYFVLMSPSSPLPAPARRGRPRKPRNVELLITLAGIDPPVWRRVRVPGEYTLHQLHRVIQLLFGWLDYHPYDFRVGERRFEAPGPEAEDEDSTSVTLVSLGLARGSRLTCTYGFGDEWVHEIEVEDVYVTTPYADEPRLPRLFNGGRAGPPEDCGGPHGYARMLQALDEPRDPEGEEHRRWIGGRWDAELFDRRMVANNLALAAAWGAI
jgi:hypothetical protein